VLRFVLSDSCDFYLFLIQTLIFESLINDDVEPLKYLEFELVFWLFLCGNAYPVKI
jgi:hypothetical protein